MTRSFLWDTPPHCPTPACYVHGVPEQEHHVAGCPMYDTLNQHVHRLNHALTDVGRAASWDALMADPTFVDALREGQEFP
jgi:hypothetical protein